ncbi:hypothetical protein WEI85_45570 [Actinomycetes bacterium KLBMP 9797]
MTEPTPIEDLASALTRRDLPTVGVWNRIEGRPRTTDFGHALRVEVRDPLWLLTRQWQLGEFRGSDAGSPVTVTYSVAATPPTRFWPDGGAPAPLPADRPLEAVAERRAVPFTRGTEPISYDLRLIIGRRWLKLLGQQLLLRGLRKEYVRQYRIVAPNPRSDVDTPRVAHPEVWAAMQAVADRRMDGYLLYRHIVDGGHAWDGIAGSFLVRDQLDALGRRLVAWFDTLIDQPRGDATWDARRLEHRFSVAAGPRTLTAQEYPGGQLDWHAFSVDPSGPIAGTGSPPPPINRTVFPAPVRFSGMPLPRWWAIEDGSTNFAAVRPDSTDLARLIFLEFALVYSNDWFHVPCDLPAGTVATIRGLAVTDVFGQRLWIKPVGAGDDEDRLRWTMFTLDTIGNAPVPADTALFLPPSVPKIAEGPPLEQVMLARDELANMVWGIEQTVRLPNGDSRRGSEVAAEVMTHRRRLFPEPPIDDPRAPIAYRAMTSVPENWIPFIAVHVGQTNRAIQLQRGAIPSEIDGQRGRPRTALLREGLDAGQRYFINEEEVPQTGTRLAVAYNRTRWHNGRVCVWLSAHRTTGRGEATTPLAFDHLVTQPWP